VGTSQGWLGSEWLVIISLALSATFVIASPLNTAADALYRKHRERLCKFETNTRHPDDQPVDPGDASIGIFGMGRLGTMAYDFMHEKYGNTVLGFDFNPEKVKQHCEAGRRVVYADPTDPDFWARITRRQGQSRMILLTMPKHQANLAAVRHLVEIGFPGKIAAIASFDDHVTELKEAGVEAAFNFYNEAGLGFAEHARKILEDQKGHESES
jgi:D-arabinose 1-dehydrogenase-like Zn-dependent alcohol dehydrogenase